MMTKWNVVSWSRIPAWGKKTMNNHQKTNDIPENNSYKRQALVSLIYKELTRHWKKEKSQKPKSKMGKRYEQIVHRNIKTRHLLDAWKKSSTSLIVKIITDVNYIKY